MKELRWVASVACLTALALAVGQKAFAEEDAITVKRAKYVKAVQDSEEQVKRKEAEEEQKSKELAEARKAFRDAAARDATADELKKLDQRATQASVARDNARIEKIKAEDENRKARIAAQAAGVTVPPKEADQPDGPLGPRQPTPRGGLDLDDEFLDDVIARNNREQEGSYGSKERQSQFLQNVWDGAKTFEEANRLAREAELRRQEEERQRQLAERRRQEEMRRREREERARIAKQQEIERLKQAIRRLAATADDVRRSGSRARINAYNAEFDRLMNRLKGPGKNKLGNLIEPKEAQRPWVQYQSMLRNAEKCVFFARR